MSFGIAGALMGAGDGLSKSALQMMEDRRRKMEMESAQKHDIDMLERKEALLRSRPKRGGGSGGGPGRKWTASDDVRVTEAWNSIFGPKSDYPGEPPSLLEYKNMVRANFNANPNLTRDQVAQLTSEQWGLVTIPEEQDRGFFDPVGWLPERFGGSDTTTVNREEYQWLNAPPVGGGGGAPPVGGGGGAGGGGAGGFQKALGDLKAGSSKKTTATTINKLAPPKSAVAALMANPDKADEFDKMFGAGASAAYLRQ